MGVINVHLPNRRFKHTIALLLLSITFLQLYYLIQLNNPASVRKNEKDMVKQLIVLEKEQYSTNYNDLLSKYELNDLASTSLYQRCNSYFNSLYVSDISWKIDPNEEFDYDNSIFSKSSFIVSQIRALKREKAKELGLDEIRDLGKIQTTDSMRKLAEMEYNIKWEKTMKVEQSLINSVTHLRNFGSCFINNDISNDEIDESTSKKAKSKNALDDTTHEVAENSPLGNGRNSAKFLSLCSDIESRIFPWLTRGLPIFRRWNGDTVIGFPKMSDYVDYNAKDVISLNHNHKKPGNLDSFGAADTARPSTASSSFGKMSKRSITKKFLSSAFEYTTNSAGDFNSDSNDACFLKSLQKSFNGKGIILTISDSHVDDVKRLIYLLRGLNNKLPIEIIYQDNLSPANIRSLIAVARDEMEHIPESFDAVEQYVGVEFPPQELWFVNAGNSIQNSYKNKFSGFGNKFLALLFSSFEENLLIDSDTILFRKPSDFFQLKNYTSTGSFFFKDRTLADGRAEQDLNFFKKLMPSKLDELLFGIPATTDFTLKNNFFSGKLQHHMESGVVVMNKKTHFSSVLMMAQLYFWSPTSMRVYGDKEIFWLGSSIAGDENYHFNHYHAASVGTLTPITERQTPNKNEFTSNEVCSNHPGHISEEDGTTLLWMNSGFRYCKKNALNDFTKKQRLKFLESAQEMQNFYNSKTKITHAIVPPGKLNDLTRQNKDHEPTTGWQKFSYCEGYYYCAFDRIGGESNSLFGKMVEFDNATIALFDYYGDLWIQDWQKSDSSLEGQIAKISKPGVAVPGVPAGYVAPEAVEGS